MSLTSIRNAYASRRRDIDNTLSILRRRAEIMRKYDFPELRKLREEVEREKVKYKEG